MGTLHARFHCHHLWIWLLHCQAEEQETSRRSLHVSSAITATDCHYAIGTASAATASDASPGPTWPWPRPADLLHHSGWKAIAGGSAARSCPGRLLCCKLLMAKEISRFLIYKISYHRLNFMLELVQ